MPDTSRVSAPLARKPARGAVAGSIFLALGERTLQRNQVKLRLPEFIDASNRDSDRYGVGKYGLRSLDAPLFADGTITLADTINRELWDQTRRGAPKKARLPSRAIANNG
jgi:hypothetical protein